MGMPSVYQEPDTVTGLLENETKPSAAKVPGTGIFGIEVLTVSLSGSNIMSYIVCPSTKESLGPSLFAAVVVELRSPTASAILCATLAGSVDLSNGLCSGPN
jgi:hypothetical protein